MPSRPNVRRRAGGKPAGTCAPNRRAGTALNAKRVRRLWLEEGLICEPKARKKRRTGPGVGEEKRLSAKYPMYVLSFDFQSDVTSCGWHVRFLNVIDEHTRTALPVTPCRSFKAMDAVAVLESIIAETSIEPARPVG